jgi:hypothetical protein
MATELVGMVSLRRKLGLLKDVEAAAAKREVKRALVNIEAGAKRRVRVDRGGLRNSITHQTREQGLSGVAGTNSEYGPATEFGRKPGSFPPLDAIKEWAKRKGIPEEAAYPIALKIAREGIEEAPFLVPAFEEERPKFLARLEAALDEANRKVARS